VTIRYSFRVSNLKNQILFILLLNRDFYHKKIILIKLQNFLIESEIECEFKLHNKMLFEYIIWFLRKYLANEIFVIK